MTLASDLEGRSTRLSHDEGFALGMITLVDAGLVWVWFSSSMRVVEAVGIHSLAVFGCGLALWLGGKADRGRFIGAGALLLLLGPLGGPTLFLARLMTRSLGGLVLEPEVEPADSDEASDALALHEQIVQGRRHALTPGRPGRFATAFAGADKAAQYRTIAAIARSYSPRMRPALDQALKSPDAALRVQAAAVFAKLRTTYAERGTEVMLSLQDNPRGANMAALAREARDVALSGFVEEDVSRHLLTAANVLESRSARPAPAPVARPVRPDVSSDVTVPVETTIRRYSCGGLG